MKKLLIITFLLISNIGFSQLKSIIINSETKEKIPYVNIWVENENIGTTSNEKGKFELEIDGSKIIIFSAIGFETKKILSDSIKNVLELKPFVFELDEIVIKPRKQNRKLKIGKIRKSKIKAFYTSQAKPIIVTRYFGYKEKYNQTTFLDKIRILTYSQFIDSKFNIKLYGINNEGKPEGYIYSENITGIAKKGKNITEVDISDLNIDFPKDGFFLAVEWLIIKSNEYELNTFIAEKEKREKVVHYAPGIGFSPAKTDENNWVFRLGKWEKGNKSKIPLKKYKGKHQLLAIELILTN